jgi:hypothetical protein
MKSLRTLAIGAVGVAAVAGASAPAAAQYYPGYNYGYGYGGGYQYGYPTNTIGQVLQSILNPYGQFGYGGYGRVHPQVAVNQCVAAVQQQLSYQGGYGYGGYGYGAYGNRYGAGGQIVGINRVEQRSPTILRVRGYASSGRIGGYGGYGYGGYGYGGYGQPDLTFKCDVDYRGYVRDVDFRRRF